MAVQLAVAAAVGLAAVVGSAFTAWMASEDAKKAQEFQDKHSAEITKLINDLQSPDFSRELTPKEIGLLTQIPDLGAYIAGQQPELLPELAKTNPELVQHISETEPQVAKFITENQPETIKALSEGAQKGRKAQEQALASLMKVGTEGDIVGQSERTRMMNQVSQQEAGQRGALTEEMARRGQLGSGRELLMKLAGQQASQQQAADLGMQSFEDAQKRRLEALMQGANIGSNMFAQDVGIERDNASIINSFNQRQTEAQRRLEEQRIADINNRQVREAQAKRDLQSRRAGEVVQNKKDNWLMNEDFKDKETQAKRDYQERVDDQAAKEAEAYANLTLSERAKRDDIEQLKYENEMAKINAKQGVGQAQSAANFSKAEATRQSGQAAVQTGLSAVDKAMGLYDRYNKQGVK